MARVFATPHVQATGETHATVVIHRGRLVAERYAVGKNADETFYSWSMAKSMLHACLGMMVRDGKLDVQAPAAVPGWQDESDPRRQITVDQLLRMSSGLGFNEDYVDAETSDAIEMLFGSGKPDAAAYAESKSLEHSPGSFWPYSSGTTNILAALLGRLIGGDPSAYRGFLHSRLFDRIGMSSADPRFDDAGNWVASSFVFARAEDFARFGLLYLRNGIWEGERLLPEGWVDYARTPTPTNELGEYGAHWWLATDGTGTFSANGYRGQYIVLSPERDVIVVRHGATEPDQAGGNYLYMREILDCFPVGEPTD
ncbi:MAG: serine hydrolase [bacterium]|nr:serine hydrolase [bacterium]